MFNMLFKIMPLFFGSSSNGKGVVDSIADVVDRFIPSEKTKFENALKNLEAGDASQDSARKMLMPTHSSWLDVLVDAINRLIRPTMTVGIMGILFGWWAAPNLDAVHPIILNVAWTIVTFWFGSRVLLKDLPGAIAIFKKSKREGKERLDDIELSDYDDGEYTEPTIKD